MNKEHVEPVLVVDKPALVGEGSIWDAQNKVVYWVDILSHELYIYDPATQSNRTVLTCQSVGTVVPRTRGGVAVALHNGFAVIDLDTDKITPLVDPERTVPANRFNEGKCDPAGRFWAGTMEFNGEADRGALYCLDVDHSVTKKIEPVTISNGIVWTADHKTMYYVDTGLNSVRGYDYDIDSGDISNERVVVENEGAGHFDGMSIDCEGMLWIALFGGAGIKRYDPNSATLLRDIGLPMSQVTSCAFGGENLDELYITSAAINLDEDALAQQPLAGSLVKIDPGVQGVEAFAYGG